jgi:FMN phosphatase YigB (HAD superfamily)
VLSQGDVVFLLDVDNTLLDNDRFGADLGARLEQSFGADQRDRYWTIFATLRDETSYADYPFAERLYARALEVVAHLSTLGLPVVLSDGDVVFQPRKIQRSGIWNAVEGRVLIDIHKERSLAAMQRRYPARHYVMVDDKAQLLAAMKIVLGQTLTTVFVRQGHYAAQSVHAVIEPPPDIEIERIDELLDHDLSDFSPLRPPASRL